MNDQIVLTIAETILANTKLLQTLVESLPKETKKKVAEKVADATPVSTPVATPVSVTPVVVETVTPVVVETPTPVLQPMSVQMPAAPFPTTPVAPAPVPTQAAPVTAPAAPVVASASPSSLPFHDHTSMLKWVMDCYTKMGPEKGALIQGVLDKIGVKNINEVPVAQYPDMVAGITALMGS